MQVQRLATISGHAAAGKCARVHLKSGPIEKRDVALAVEPDIDRHNGPWYEIAPNVLMCPPPFLPAAAMRRGASSVPVMHHIMRSGPTLRV